MKENGDKEPQTTPNEKQERDFPAELKNCEKQRAEYLAGWQRARADFLNYKKEEMERMKRFTEYVGDEFILGLFPILDNLNEAEKKIPEPLKKDENVKGLLQIKSQIIEFLAREGVREIDVIGKKFDPNYHEAGGEEEKNGVQSGQIIEEIQKGYGKNGRVLRTAKVKVAK